MMNFQRREVTIELGGQEATIRELSAAEFATIMELDQEEQAYALLFTSLVEKPESAQAIGEWPNSIVNQLSSSVMALNGLTEQGN